MMRGFSVLDPKHSPVADPPAYNSPVLKHSWVSVKFLAAYSVAIVNGVALLYILVRMLRGIRRLLDGS